MIRNPQATLSHAILQVLSSLYGHLPWAQQSDWPLLLECLGSLSCSESPTPCSCLQRYVTYINQDISKARDISTIGSSCVFLFLSGFLGFPFVGVWVIRLSRLSLWIRYQRVPQGVCHHSCYATERSARKHYGLWLGTSVFFSCMPILLQRCWRFLQLSVTFSIESYLYHVKRLGSIWIQNRAGQSTLAISMRVLEERPWLRGISQVRERICHRAL